MQGLLAADKKVAQEIAKEIDKTFQFRTDQEALERAKGVSRRFFFCCDYKPKHVTVDEFRLALAMDIPTYIMWMAGQPKKKYNEMRILISATEMVSVHALKVTAKESSKHKESVWIAFPGLGFLLEHKWKGVTCSLCGKNDDTVKLCPVCNCGMCPTCPPHLAVVCIITRIRHEKYMKKYYPNLLKPSNLQICVKCHDFLKPVLYCPCKMVTYCSKKCQRDHRAEHKSECTYVPKEKKKKIAVSE
jgi:hypothetical protein